jgi:hypothetical protein
VESTGRKKPDSRSRNGSTNYKDSVAGSIKVGFLKAESLGNKPEKMIFELTYITGHIWLCREVGGVRD